MSFIFQRLAGHSFLTAFEREREKCKFAPVIKVWPRGLVQILRQTQITGEDLVLPNCSTPARIHLLKDQSVEVVKNAVGGTLISKQQMLTWINFLMKSAHLIVLGAKHVSLCAYVFVLKEKTHFATVGVLSSVWSRCHITFCFENGVVITKHPKLPGAVQNTTSQGLPTNLQSKNNDKNCCGEGKNNQDMPRWSCPT